MGDGPAQVDLRAIETRNTMSRLMNSYEKAVADAVTVGGNYESGLYSAFSPGVSWGQSGSKPIADILTLKRAVANQIGVRPNSMVLGIAAFDTLLTDPDIVDRIRYTSADSVDVDVLARYFGLSRGVRVAEGRYLDNTGKLSPIFPETGVLLFYSPEGSSNGVMPSSSASLSTPAFALNNIVKFKRASRYSASKR